MNLSHFDQDELAALAARRAAQVRADADHRAIRLAEARRREEDLFAGAERLTRRMGHLLRRLKQTGPDDDRPIALRQPDRDAAPATRRDAA